jgi:hypothetical protein
MVHGDSCHRKPPQRTRKERNGPARLSLSPCGHLSAEVDGSDWLAGPDLAALAPLPRPDGWTTNWEVFSRTGEQLLRSGLDGSLLRDLATGREVALPPAGYVGFLPSHDLDRSILVRCTPDGTFAVDRGVERAVAPGAQCAGSSFLAPIVLARNAEEQLLVVDLDRGTVFPTGLPFRGWSDREEPSPTGEPGYRHDDAFLSPDGARLLLLQRWWVTGEDTVEVVGTGEVKLVDADTGATTVFPGGGTDPVGMLPTGFVWNAAGRTLFAGAAGDGELGFPCDHAEPWGSSQRVLLRCDHESSRYHLLDSDDLATRALGSPWWEPVLSPNVRAIAGCPQDRWRDGSCTEPVVRRWVEGHGIHDLPLDRPADVLWVGDDGAVLAIATLRDEAILLDARGAVKTRFPLRPRPDGMPRLARARGWLLVLADSLELLVPETGLHRRLADRWELVGLDGRGERVAFTVPDDDAGARLFAGAVPR